MAIPYKYKRNAQAIGDSMMIALPAIWCKANTIKKGTKLLMEVYTDRVIITKIAS